MLKEKYFVKNLGFILDDVVVFPNSVIDENLNILYEDKILITIDEDILQELLENGYIVTREIKKPKSKYEIGSLVKTKKKMLRRILSRHNHNKNFKNIDDLNINGLVKDKEFCKEANTWKYKINLISNTFIDFTKEDKSYLIEDENSFNDYICYESEIEPIDTIEFIVDKSTDNNKKILIKVERL